MEFLKVTEQREPFVALIELNRPKELNALNSSLMGELRDVLVKMDKDDRIRAIVITGNDQAFAAGADIKEMASKNAVDMLAADLVVAWEQIKRVHKPLVAAISGYALGGGFELVMLCDMVIASETARVGQPEIKIGTIPGAGGTQRLTRAVGKVKAMEMVLTGRTITAAEALSYGLVNKVVPPEFYLHEALSLAKEIATMSPVATQLGKDAVNRAFEAHLDEGLAYERRNFYLTFASEDQKEGMSAFIEKRKPSYKGK
jgi:enoyl-CoA hydratase